MILSQNPVGLSLEFGLKRKCEYNSECQSEYLEAASLQRRLSRNQHAALLLHGRHDDSEFVLTLYLIIDHTLINVVIGRVWTICLGPGSQTMLRLRWHGCLCFTVAWRKEQP